MSNSYKKDALSLLVNARNKNSTPRGAAQTAEEDFAKNVEAFCNPRVNQDLLRNQTKIANTSSWGKRTDKFVKLTVVQTLTSKFTSAKKLFKS